MKALKWIAWISAVIGVLFILIGGIEYLFKVRVIGAESLVQYFNTASTFFLFTIMLFVFLYRCECKK
jgi:hypothetical protein